MTRTRIAVCLVLAVQVVARASEAQPVDEGILEELSEDEIQEVDAVELTEPNFEGVVWQSDWIGRKRAKFLRLRLSGLALPTDISIRIQVVSPDGTPVETLDQRFLEGRSFVWTQVFRVSKVYVRVLADRKPQGLKLRVDQLVYSPIEISGLLSKIGGDDREDLYKIQNEEILRAAAAVAKLSYLKNGKRPRSCTGFLIGRNLLLTNDHCINDQETCESAIAWFGFQKTSRAKTQRGEQFRCARLVRSCLNLDYALLELQGVPGDVYGQLELDPRSLKKTDRLILVQHPGGRPKMVSRDAKCEVVTEIGKGRSGNTDFGYGCDTEDGSSGSPVLLADSLKVVGLHHLRGTESGLWTKQNRGVRMESLSPELQADPSPSPLCPRKSEASIPGG